MYPCLFLLSGAQDEFDDDGPSEGSSYSLDDGPPSKTYCAAHYRDPTRYHRCRCDICEPPIEVINLTQSESESELEMPGLEEKFPEGAAYGDSYYDADDGRFASESPLRPNSPTYSPSSPSYDQSPDEHTPHIHLSCWHTDRCTSGNEMVSVMDDRRGLGFYECLECCLHWRYRHHAIEHFRSNEHRRRLSFLKGDPMIYCMVCNRLPISKELHELSQEHTQHLAGLERAALPTDCTLRQVSECADGRLRASWFPLGFNVEF
jgi:hypothetical protein